MSSAPDPRSLSSLEYLIPSCRAQFEVLTQPPKPISTATDVKNLTPAFFKIQFEKFERIMTKGRVYHDNIPSLEERFSVLRTDNNYSAATKGLLRDLDGSLTTAYEALGGAAAYSFRKGSRMDEVLWRGKSSFSKEHVHVHITWIIGKLEEIFGKLNKP